MMYENIGLGGMVDRMLRTSIITIDIENGLIWGYDNPYFSDPVMTYIPTYEK